MNLTSFISKKTLLLIARKTGFVTRAPRKIQPFAFLASCLLAINSGFPHLRLQSVFAGLLSNTTVSKQALHKRMGDASSCFMQSVLAHLFSRQICVKNLSHSFARILIADSTCISLPESHRDLFPGPSNGRVDAACVRIQGLFELISEQFLDFKVSPFTRNDQAASGDLLPFLKPRDLVLRDLGYFNLTVFASIHLLGGFFLSRWRYGITLTDPSTLKSVHLLGLLRRHGSLDIPLILGKDHPLPVRLVAFPLPPQVANAKRRKANQDRDRRTNHSKTFMALLSWNIFITNADSEMMPIQLVSKLHSLRWKVEILFKSWKSHLHLNSLSRVGKRQIKTLLYAHLILTLLLHQSIALTPPEPLFASAPSILKLAQLYTWAFPILLFGALLPELFFLLLKTQIQRHCSYEKRSRTNFNALKAACLS